MYFIFFVSNFVSIFINNNNFLLKEGISILEACNYAGINISRFCFHETLSIAGNCRMCLVELDEDKVSKPIASCVHPIVDELILWTDTPMTKKARENVLELLLLNHPLDCPICDQGGECDLQDQTQNFGLTNNRFYFQKRSVEDKNCSPIIKTIMTRCIHCTRCVRFFSEVLQIESLGTLSRGTHMEIGPYLNLLNQSELSGNVIDLCPVGALTSKPYASEERPWELKVVESVDSCDSLGSNIYTCFKESKLIRILPKINYEINDNLISDKTRFSFDGIYNNRLLKPTNTNFHKDLFSLINKKSTEKKALTTFFVDANTDLKTLNSIKNLLFVYGNSLSINSLIHSTNTNSFNFDLSFLSSKIQDVNSNSRFGLLVCVNPLLESAILNFKIRRKILNEDFTISKLGLFNNYGSSKFEFINLTKDILLKFLDSKNYQICKLFIGFKFPIVFFSENLILRGWNPSVLMFLLKKIIPTSILIFIRSGSNNKGLSFLNIKPINKSIISKSTNKCSIGLNETLLFIKNILLNANSSIPAYPKAFKFIFSTHSLLKGKVSESYNEIPLCSHFEDEKFFFNLEERPQQTNRSLNINPDIKSFTYWVNYFIWLKRTLDNSFTSKFRFYVNVKLENQQFLNEILYSPFLFKQIDMFFSFNLLNKFVTTNSNLIINLSIIKNKFEDSYCSGDLISKHSYTMQKCSLKVRENFKNF